jgi:hypothetical protein
LRKSDNLAGYFLKSPAKSLTPSGVGRCVSAPHFFQKDRELCQTIFEKSGNFGKHFWKSPVTLPDFFRKLDNLVELFLESPIMLMRFFRNCHQPLRTFKKMPGCRVALFQESSARAPNVSGKLRNL